MRRFFCVLTAGLLAAALSGCAAPGGAAAETQVIAMDTAMGFTAYGPGGESAVQAAVEEVRELERLLSRTEEDSEVARLNRGEQAALSPETAALIDAALEYGRRTGGAFDPTIAPVADAWGFTKDAYRVPETAELTELLARVGPEHIHREGDGAALDAGTAIDLGGIAKGYASDRVEGIFAEHGVETGMVDMGGNVYVRGAKTDGTPWRVGVRDPENDAGLAAVLSLEDAFAITSGGYERFFEAEGRTYHHILDPKTGSPAESGLLSVTVVAPANGYAADTVEPGSGTMCDALSTSLFILGEDRALDFWRTSGLDFELVLVTADGRVVSTAGLGDRLAAVEDSGYVYETVA